MRKWILDNALADAAELDAIEENAVAFVKESKQKAWTNYHHPLKNLVKETVDILNHAIHINPEISNVIKELNAIREPMRRDVLKSLASILDSL